MIFMYSKQIILNNQNKFDKKYMLEVVTGNQIIFEPVSASDSRLKGDIILKNPNKDRYIVYKIKSTDINAFQANPSKAIIKPLQKITIPVITTRQVDANYAKILAQKNKFQIEYAIIGIKPYSIDQAVSELKEAGAQSIKIYINTNSVRTSSIGKSYKQSSIAGTNRNSFHSMIPNQKVASPNLIGMNQTNDQMLDLKTQIDSLEKQRTRLLKDLDNKGKNNKGGGILKYIILLTVGLIVGNVTSHYCGMNSYLKQKLHTKPTPKKQQGFWSIFNFGNGQSGTSNYQQQNKKSWWNIL